MDMTVEQNVALGLKFRGTPKEETQSACGAMDEALGHRVSVEAAGRSVIWGRGAEGQPGTRLCVGTGIAIA